jgi:hypothetical protein
MVFNISFREYYFYYLLLGIILIVGVFSYFRFMVYHDYVVYYEGECNPNVEICFVGCEDDECTEEYYYTEVQKYAPDLLKVCGNNITDCAEANICLSTDQNCSITYCDSEVDGVDCAVPDQDQGDSFSSDADLLLEEEDNIE